VIATGLALSVISALVIIPRIVDTPTTAAAPTVGRDASPSVDPGAPGSGTTPVPEGVDWKAVETDYPEVTGCDGQPASDCTIVQGTGAHVLLIGDSHAGTLIPALRAIAQREGLTFSADLRAGCPWQRGLYRVPKAPSSLNQPIAPCRRHKDDLYDRVIPALRPDLIIAMNVDYPRRNLPFVGPDEEVLAAGPALDAWLEQTTVSSVDELEADGRRIVLVEPVPVAEKGVNPVSCLSSATVVEECRYVVSTTPSSLEELYRRLDRQDDSVWSADLDRLVCPYLPICDPIVGGRVVQIDGSHLTTAYSSFLAPDITRYLEANGLLTEP
jgi:hypothetical protein